MDNAFDYLTSFLKASIENDASDIHFVANEQVKFRIKDKLVNVGKKSFNAPELQAILTSSMTVEEQEEYKRNKEVDYGLKLEGVGRFRVNAYTAGGNMEAVMRVIKEDLPSREQLNLPRVIEKLSEHQDGLVLIAGATGSGKSTTLAAMINHVNTNFNKRIITVEDPVEIIHKNIKSVVTQREVGEDTVSYDRALKSLMRQNPDIILIGEIRDRFTATSALQAAQTGHLVLSTIHASSAEETISRFAGLYPVDERPNIKQMLAYSLRGIIAQRLIVHPETRNKIPVMEIMMNSKRVEESILNDSNGNPERESLSTIIREESIYDMNTLDQYLIGLVMRKVISAEQAVEEASNKLWTKQQLHSRGLI